MSTKNGSRALNGNDQIGKLFVVRSHGLRECLVCGELFTRSTAPAHAEVNCYPAVEFCRSNQQEEQMSLTKYSGRKNRIIVSITSGNSDTSPRSRRHEQIAGRTNETFNTVRDAHGNLVSINSVRSGFADPA